MLTPDELKEMPIQWLQYGLSQALDNMSKYKREGLFEKFQACCQDTAMYSEEIKRRQNSK